MYLNTFMNQNLNVSEYKHYLLTQSKKYQDENIWYNMPNSEENNTIYIPEYTCIFWEMEISLVNFTAGKAAKISG